MELSAQAFPRYFKAIERERTLAAHDACGDPRTSEFAEAYLRPLGITSMLDVPIWVGDTMIGVLCHEHVGPMRTWTSDDESFAFLMADVLSLALERR
jgi:GAF domain-containing protein